MEQGKERKIKEYKEREKERGEEIMKGLIYPQAIAGKIECLMGCSSRFRSHQTPPHKT